MDVLTEQFRLLIGEDLIEDVVASLSFQLEGDSRLFQQVCNMHTHVNFSSSSLLYRKAVSPLHLLTGLNVTRGQFSRGTKMNTNEFTLASRQKVAVSAVFSA